MSLCTMCWTLLLISRLTTPLVLQLTHLLIKKLKKDWCLMLLICSTLEHAIGGRYLKKTKREWGTDFCRNKDPRKLSMSIPFSTSPSTPIITGIVVALFPTFVQSWFLGLIIYYYHIVIVIVIVIVIIFVDVPVVVSLCMHCRSVVLGIHFRYIALIWFWQAI